jgi:hypothetical protein
VEFFLIAQYAVFQGDVFCGQLLEIPVNRPFAFHPSVTAFAGIHLRFEFRQLKFKAD